MALYTGLYGILLGLTRSPDHPRRVHVAMWDVLKLAKGLHMGASKKQGPFLGSPYHKDHSILRPIWTPVYGKP